MNHVPEVTTCTACAAIDQVYRFTPLGQGPFCQQCWKNLNDPDQQLHLEERLELLEAENEGRAIAIKAYKSMLAQAADALEVFKYDVDWILRKQRLIAELRKAAE